MEIICDTNIWYEIGSGNLSTEFLNKDDKLIATYISIEELSRTIKNLNKPDASRKAIQSMFKYSKKHAIYTPPFAYLKEISDKNYSFDVMDNVIRILKVTEQIANGGSIAKDQIDNYKKQFEDYKKRLRDAADFFTVKGKEIQKRLNKNYRKHREQNSIPLNRELIAQWVSIQTGIKTVVDKIQWEEVELFEKTLKVAFNEVETGAISFKQNHWYDLFNLIYVSPDKQYWTLDGDIISFIEKAKMEHYLIRR